MSRFNKGATLIEVLVAAAVLAIGLSAIAAVLTHTSMSARNGLRKGEVALAGASTLDSWSARGYSNLAFGTYDAGTVFTPEGTELYTQRMTVADGGPNAVELQLAVTWRDVTLGTTAATGAVVRTQRYLTVVTGGFVDGGF